MDAICPLLSSPPSLPDAERKQKLVPGNTVPRTRGWLCDMGALLIEINDMWGKQVGDGDLRFKSDRKLSERVLCIRFLCIKGVRGSIDIASAFAGSAILRPFNFCRIGHYDMTSFDARRFQGTERYKRVEQCMLLSSPLHKSTLCPFVWLADRCGCHARVCTT